MSAAERRCCLTGTGHLLCNPTGPTGPDRRRWWHHASLEEVWSLVHHVLAWCVVVGGGGLPGVRHNLFSRIALERCFSETSESFYSSWYNGVKNKKRGGCQMESGVSVFGRWRVNGSQASPASFNQSSDLLLGSTNWPQNMFWLGVCCQVSYTFKNKGHQREILRECLYLCSVDVGSSH